MRFNGRMENGINSAPADTGPSGNTALNVDPGSAGVLRNAVAQAPTIYIVDDDEAVRLALRMLVISFGWKARAFESGQAFFDALPQGTPDCILLDLDMPGMNGAEVQESLQARRIEVPVIIITGQKNTQLVSRARAAGARDMLSKPFQDDALKLLIERTLHLEH